jgi:hypothetical protein
MTLRANFQKSYLFRYLIFIFVCFPLTLWFLYDGAIAWPRQLPIIRAYEAIDKNLEPKAVEEKWKELALANGWSKKPPEKSLVEMESAILGQYFWASLSLIVGGVAAIYYVKSRNSWIEKVDGGLRTSWGQSLEFGKVTRIDKSKWEAKGIAKAFYMDKGQRRAFTFDDFKFDREPIGRMLYDLEQVVPPGQIHGGPLEPPPPELAPKSPETTPNSDETSNGASTA